MARSRTGTFADADLFQQAGRVGRTELFVAAAGKFHGELTAIDLQRLWLQHVLLGFRALGVNYSSPSGAGISAVTINEVLYGPIIGVSFRF
jgi:hypothetical protein